MEKYLIEVPHGEDKASCRRAIQVFLDSGSHFVSNADWGCMDGEHKAWIVVEVESKKEATRILPSAFAHVAKITKLNKFTRKVLDESVMDYHED